MNINCMVHFSPVIQMVLERLNTSKDVINIKLIIDMCNEYEAFKICCPELKDKIVDSICKVYRINNTEPNYFQLKI